MRGKSGKMVEGVQSGRRAVAEGEGSTDFPSDIRPLSFWKRPHALMLSNRA